MGAKCDLQFKTFLWLKSKILLAKGIKEMQNTFL